MSAYAIVIIAICGIYMLLNFKHDIHMLQQNSYRPERYMRWLRKGDMTSAWRLTDVALLILALSTSAVPTSLISLAVALVCLGKTALILRKKFKKPLVFTNRVRRIYAVTGILAAGAVAACAICTAGKTGILHIYSGAQLTLAVILAIAILSWCVVIIALFLLSPVEKAINNRFRNEAISILRSMPNLKIIGITGSFGKTSTKHYLHRILSEHFETLMTPGSYNTPMGVIRTVREMMKPYTEVFICEMGAKQTGDIKEICDIVHPHDGIITAVGPMHLETFRSIENVQATKFELADALPADGLAVVNNDFEYCASRKVDNVKCLRYSTDTATPADYHAEDIKYSADGTTFAVTGPDGFRIELFTRLVGDCNISNLVAAVIMAIHMGVPEDKIRYAVGRIEQVEHRLSTSRTPGGITIIDDAFNSNPTGSRMAVDVLSHFSRDGRRIIVTPGMVELGDSQYELNKELGEYIGRNVDEAFIVGAYNREALLCGLREAGFPEEHTHITDSFAEAQAELSSMMKAGDAILYENDLPDSFK